MKTKKRILAMIATVAMLCMALTGCGAKPAPADQTVGALFELAAKNNAAPMKDLLGFASEEDVQSAFFDETADTELVDELKSELTSAGLELSDEEVKNLSDSILALLNKITYTSEITAEDGDTTVVTLKINGFSYEEMTQIMVDASTTMVESLTEEDQLAILNGDMDVFNAYMQQYLQDFMDGLAAMEPNSESKDITVTCEKLKVNVSGKEKTAWLPSDMDGFAEDITGAMFR